MKEFTFSIHEVDLKKYINYDSIFDSSLPGSRTYYIRQLTKEVMKKLEERKMLPFPFLDFVELIFQACDDSNVIVGKRYVREVTYSYLKAIKRVASDQKQGRSLFIF